MKSKSVKVVALILCICMSVMQVVAADSVFVTDKSKEYSVNQTEALNAYQSLWDSFDFDEEGNAICPDEYAGEYITEDNKLAICLTFIDDKVKEEYISRCKNADILVFELVDYSLRDLNDIGEKTVMMLSDYRISSYYIARKDNAFVVSVVPDDYTKAEKTLSDEGIAVLEDSLVKKYSKDEIENVDKIELPVIIKSEGYAEATTTLYGGMGVTNSYNANMSIGIGGYYNGKEALLTCGHGNASDMSSERANNYHNLISQETNTNVKLKYGSDEIGSISYMRCSRPSNGTSNPSPVSGTAGLGDFAIVTRSNTTIHPQNKVYIKKGNVSSYVYVTGYYSSVPEQTIIYKSGIVTNESSWRVIATSVVATYTDNYGNPRYVVGGLTRSTYTSSSGSANAIKAGDSGGAVYVYSNANSNPPTCLFAGTVSGNVYSQTTQQYDLYHSPIGYAINAGFSLGS